MTIAPRARFALKTLFVLLSCSRLIMFSSEVSAAAGNQVKPIFQNVLSNELFLLDLNADRSAAGLAPLRMNDELNVAAESKAKDMIANNYWDHFRPSDHKAPWEFIDESGYAYRVAGENLARGFRTEAGITDAWMKSPAHRANMLSNKYREVGFASIYTYDETGVRILLSVEMFGAK